MKTLEQLKWEYLALPEDVDPQTRYTHIKELISGVDEETLDQFSEWLREYRDSFKPKVFN